MIFSDLQIGLSQKIGTTETINFTSEKRNQSINDALSTDILRFCKWTALEVTKPITFLRKAYLICGVTPLTTFSDWTSISDGSFKFSVDGTEYNVDSIDYSAATDMDGVASIIQTAIRTATSGLETVDYLTDYFVISSGTTGSTSAITVLSTSTGTVGTDISGGSYLNGTSDNGEIVAWVTSLIPSNYDEMVALYVMASGDKSTEYHYLPPTDFNSGSALKWTIKEVFGTKKIVLNDTTNITLYAQYRRKPPLLAEATDDPLFSSEFKEAILLYASSRLLMYSNHNDQRIGMFKNLGFTNLQSLRLGDTSNSTRYMKRVRRSNRYANPYGYNYSTYRN